jgi:hypothetical protein
VYEGFAQDSWRVTSKLKVELGGRYSVIEPYHVLWGNYDVFDARFYNPAQAVRVDPATGGIVAGSGNIYNGIVIPGNGFPSSGRWPFRRRQRPAVQRLVPRVAKHLRAHSV